MARRRKIWGIVLAVLALLVAGLGFALSYTSACPSPQPGPGGPNSMKAVLYRCYGEPNVVRVEQVDRPVIGDSGVLIKVRAVGINPVDWHFLRGTPYLMR